MKVYIKKNEKVAANCDGFELHILNDDGTEEVKPILRKDKQTAGNYCYKIPANPTNVKWISDRRMADGLELMYKEPVVGTNVRKEPLENFLDGSEKETYLRLVKVATERREAAANRQPTEAEKLMKQIERMQAQLAKLQAAE